jgi:cytochrome P450
MGAVMGLFQYFQGLIKTRLEAPGDDLVSALAHAEVDGQRLTVPEIVGFCFVMVAGGNDTATGLIGGAVELLAAHPDQRRKLAADPSLIGPSIEEFLRLTCPVQGLCRTTMEEVEIQGQKVPAGKKVHMLYASGNRDEREYGDDSEALDVTRKVNRMLSFSSGPHFCLGAALARMQGRIALEELLRRAPHYELDLDRAKLSPGMFVRRFESLPMRANA